jgi:SM-20-related protein
MGNYSPESHESKAQAAPSTALLDLASLAAAPLVREPYEHLVLPGFLSPAALQRVLLDYPRVDRPGSFPLPETRYGPNFAAFVAELEAAALRHLFEQKFALDLTGRPTTITVRGRCGKRDGRVHTDSATKIITVLIYMNDGWDEPNGRLRLLRSADLDDYAIEVPPAAGTLIAFRRSERSFHGHTSFEGERKVIQLNWVTDQRVADRELGRHSLSARLKRLFAFAGA